MVVLPEEGARALHPDTRPRWAGVDSPVETPAGCRSGSQGPAGAGLCPRILTQPDILGMRMFETHVTTSEFRPAWGVSELRGWPHRHPGALTGACHRRGGPSGSWMVLRVPSTQPWSTGFLGPGTRKSAAGQRRPMGTWAWFRPWVFVSLYLSKPRAPQDWPDRASAPNPVTLPEGRGPRPRLSLGVRKSQSGHRRGEVFSEAPQEAGTPPCVPLPPGAARVREAWLPQPTGLRTSLLPGSGGTRVTQASGPLTSFVRTAAGPAQSWTSLRRL